MTPKIETIVALLEKCKAETLATAAKVPEENRYRQLAEGKATPMWLLGHLTNTMNTVVLIWTLGESSILTRDQAKLFSPDFAGGKTPTSNPGDYPAWDEIVALYDEAMTRAIMGVGKMTDDQLPGHLAGKVPDAMREFFSSNQVTLHQMITHDSYHRGQMALLAAVPIDPA